MALLTALYLAPFLIYGFMAYCCSLQVVPVMPFALVDRSGVTPNQGPFELFIRDLCPISSLIVETITRRSRLDVWIPVLIEN